MATPSPEPSPEPSPARSKREPPEPLAVDGVPVVVGGTICWLIAFVVLVALGSDSWWRWVCLTAFGLGLIGIPYLRRFQKR